MNKDPAKRRALLLLHGWPYSSANFVGIVDALAHPERQGGRVEDAFAVVIPSLPGYGFSTVPNGPMAPRRMVALFDLLMTQQLGLPGTSRMAATGAATWQAWPDSISHLRL